MHTPHSPDSLDFSTVLASCLHDVKNSICIFLGMLEDVVSDTAADDPRFTRLLKMQYEGQRISNDMTQLLGIYRGNNAQLSPNVTEVDVADFLHEQAQVHAVMLEYKGIHVDIACDGNLTWFFDQEMISGIITNVINNAYKYTHGRLQIRAEEQDGGLVLSIKDDGPGYPARMLTDNLTGFSPVDFKGGSTGLGLGFAAMAAGLHKNKGRSGYVRITNDGIDGGGCFSLWLP